MKKLFLTGLLLVTVFHLGVAQKRGRVFNAWKADGWIEAAEKASSGGDYYAAFRYLESALAFDSTRVEVWQKYAYNALQFNAFPFAEQAYAKAYRLSGEPTDRFGQAYAMQRQGKYAAAVLIFEELLKSNNGITKLRGEVETAIANCRFGIEREGGAVEVSISQMDTNAINTPYAEYGVYLKSDSLYFSSQRIEDKKDDHIPDRFFSKLFLSVDDAAGVMLDKSFNAKGKYIAHPAFSKDGFRMYFAVCNFADEAKLRCDLVMRRKTEAGDWGELLSLPVNDPAVNNTHPVIGYDRFSGKELLFFTSDRPGGSGGLDIWYAELDEAGLPGNLSGVNFVNTPGDEVSPFFHSATQRLYFSSDGNPTMGGFDIYNTRLENGLWQQASHLPPPINTSYDDLFYSRFGCGEAYLSSNRPGSLLLDDATEACCTDIFEADVNTGVTLDILALDILTEQPLNEVDIAVFEIDAGREIPVAEWRAADPENSKIEVDLCKKYSIRCSKRGYEGKKLALDLIDFSLDGQSTPELNAFLYAGSEYEYPDTLVLMLPLMPQTARLQVRVFDLSDSSLLYGATSTLTLLDLEPGRVRPIEIKTNERDSFSVFDIQAELKYSINVEKRGFLPGYAEFVISTADIQTLGQDLVVDFYLERESFSDLLPINLYFDNNVPGRNPDTLTSQSYATLFNDYLAEKANYIESFNNDPDLSDIDKDRNIRGYDNFFDREVRLGFDSLEILVTKLAGFLQKSGNIFEIELIGSASPIGDAYYNLLLSARRVSSVYNYLMEARGGILKQYVVSGQLVVHKSYAGESEASEAARRISENLRDRRNAVYNVVACVERRVTIKAFVKE